MWFHGDQAGVQHTSPRLCSLPHSYTQHIGYVYVYHIAIRVHVLTNPSLLVSNCSSSDTSPASSAPIPLPLTTLWHGSFDSDSIRTSTTDSIYFTHGSMSAAILEPGLPCHAGFHSHDLGHGCGWGRDVLCEQRSRAFAWRRLH